MRGIFRRGDVLAGAFILSVFVSLFTLTQLVRSADDAVWSSAAQVNISRTGDIATDIFNTTPAVPCEDQEFSWKSRTSGWVSSIVTNTYTRCAVAMQDAYFETNSSIQGRIRSYSSKDKTFGLSFPALANVNVFAVPNSTSIVVNSWAYQNYYGGTPGLHIIRDYRTTMRDTGPDSATNKIYAPAKPFDFELRGPDGGLVAIKPGGLKFSPNGEWMLVKINYGGNLAWARINLDTYEVMAFAKPVQDYYSVQNAISNDGRYVAIYEPLASLRVYDLEKCSNGFNKLLSQQCLNVELYPQVKAELGASELSLRNFMFKGTQTISLFAGVKKVGETAWKYGEYTLRYGDLPTSNGYLAMGDSFSSGEGAYDYRSQTDFYVDDTQYNLCHQSRSSYPYILNKTIGFEWFGSVACSGAEREHILGTLQAKTHDLNDSSIHTNFLPGYIGQKSFLDIQNSPSPQVLTLTITGNDIGFGDILSACVHPINHLDTCYGDRTKKEKLAHLIDSQVKPLAKLLKDIKQQNNRPDFRLYMIGYPKIFMPSGKCGWNTDMNEDELRFGDALTNYLNKAIELAASNAGVYYVDVADSFVDEDGRDYRLCGNQRNLAVNGLVLRGTTSKKPYLPYYQESFHPNLLGHSLIAQTINQQTSGLSRVMPDPDVTVDQVESQLRIALVGDDGRLTGESRDSYDSSIAPAFVTRGDSLNFSENKLKADAEPGSKVTFELHSTPIKLGEGMIDAAGNITGSVTIPVSVTPGYHEIHILYSNFFGQLVDRYRITFVAASRSDYDGDNMPNTSDPCFVGAESGIDEDKDGIDDACDDEYVKQASTESGGQTKYEDVTRVIESIVVLAAQPQPVHDGESEVGPTNTKDTEQRATDGHVLNEDTDMLTFGTDSGGGYAKEKHFNFNELLIVVGALAIVATASLAASKLLGKD